MPELQLEPLPNGELAWLKPALAPRDDANTNDDDDDDVRFWITDEGRRALRLAWLFGCEPDA